MGNLYTFLSQTEGITKGPVQRGAKTGANPLPSYLDSRFQTLCPNSYSLNAPTDTFSVFNSLRPGIPSVRNFILLSNDFSNAVVAVHVVVVDSQSIQAHLSAKLLNPMAANTKSCLGMSGVTRVTIDNNRNNKNNCIYVFVLTAHRIVSLARVSIYSML